MTVDLAKPRPDMVYLRRRLKLGEQVPTAPVTTTNFLDLKRSTDDVMNGVVDTTKQVRSKPPVIARTVLTLDEPVVRFNKRQSAIGSLMVTGVTSFGWETADRDNGIITSPVSGIEQVHKYEIPVYGNRKLVEFYQGDVVISLRHFKKIRRLILAGNGVITFKLVDGNTILIDSDGGKNVAYLSVIGDVIEVRVEALLTDMDTTFSITRPPVM